MTSLGPATLSLILDSLRCLDADGIAGSAPVHDFIYEILFRLELVRLRPYLEAGVILLPSASRFLAEHEGIAEPACSSRTASRGSGADGQAETDGGT
jgi:hypothetical protein